ncbi:MAG TPA: hypothetical protein VFN90_02255 [Gemmatimonadales bacterium]|nr:hypothetical protein [Gemmatimonadales bacterium]
MAVSPRRSAVVAVLLLLGGCSAVGWELPNYGFYGYVPKPDGTRLQRTSAVERFVPIGADSVTRGAEGLLVIDSVLHEGAPAWLLTRTHPARGGGEIVDSVWLEYWELRTLASVRHANAERLKLRFDRRAVDIERTAANGKVSRRRMLHEAESYGLLGIDLVLAGMPLAEGRGGALPVVTARGNEMRWFRYQVIAKDSEARPSTVGGVVFRVVWIIEVDFDGRRSRYWIADDDRSVLRREEALERELAWRVTRERAVPLIDVAPVERLPVAGPARAGQPKVLGRP